MVLAGTAAGGRMAPPTSIRISAGLKCAEEHASPVDVEGFSLKESGRRLPTKQITGIGPKLGRVHAWSVNTMD